MRKYLMGALAGAALTVIAFVWADYPDRSQPPLSEEDRRVLIDHDVVEVEIVKEIQIIKEIPVEVPVKVVEKVTVTVPGEPVEVCPNPGMSVPNEGIPEVTLGGGCDVEILEVGSEKWARGWWSCEATTDLWTATRGPMAGESTYLMALPPDPPKWKRMWWGGAARLSGTPAIIGSVSLEHRRLGGVQVTAGGSEDGPLWALQYGRRW